MKCILKVSAKKKFFEKRSEKPGDNSPTANAKKLPCIALKFSKSGIAPVRFITTCFFTEDKGNKITVANKVTNSKRPILLGLYRPASFHCLLHKRNIPHAKSVLKNNPNNNNGLFKKITLCLPRNLSNPLVIGWHFCWLPVPLNH